MNTTAQLTVNAENLLKTLRSAFDSKRSVIRELAQNGRRAGATWIRFTFDVENNTLVVSDNGSGIRDMNALLSVAQSGWSDEVKQSESPYGLGFLAALYTASEIEVKSAGVQFIADTTDILSFMPVKLSPAVDNGFTTITLRGHSVGESMNATGSIDSMTALFRGYPITVFVDDQEIDRPHALDNGEPWQRSFGSIWQRYELHDNAITFKHDWVAYYQGFEIASNNAYAKKHEETSVIHVDSTFFEAISPGLNKPMDDYLAKRIIKSSFLDEQSRILDAIARKEGEFALLNSEQLLLNSYDEIKNANRLDIYNAIDFVPRSVLKRFENRPEALDNIRALSDVLLEPDQHISKQAIICGDNSIFRRGAYPNNTNDSFVGDMYMWLTKGYTLSEDLAGNHWLYPLLKSADNVQMELHGARLPSIPVENLIVDNGLKVMLCESYTLTGPVGAVSCESDGFLEVHELDDHPDMPIRTLIIPSKQVSGYVLRQAISFLDCNEQPNEVEMDLYASKFERWLELEKLGGDPLALLKMVLAKAIADFPPLKGNVIRAELGESGNVDIELLNLTSE